MAKYAVVALLAALALILAGCANTGTPLPLPANKNGTLAGKVSVGPLCPVEPCQVSPEQFTAAYNTRNVIVYSKDSGRKAVESALRYDAGLGAAQYNISLAPGTYTVWVSDTSGVDPSMLMRPSSIGIGGPKDADIYINTTTVLDIDVDTGIR